MPGNVGARGVTTPAIDAKRDLIIFSTGNLNPDLYGPSCMIPYTDSIVALHASNGKLAWYYQEVLHDVWDYDAVSNVVLFDTVDHGKRVPAAVRRVRLGGFTSSIGTPASRSDDPKLLSIN